MDLYFERHDGQAATVEQFVQVFRRRVGAGILPNSCCGIRRRARRRSWPTAAMMRPREFTGSIWRDVPATPGQLTKQPMVIPLAVGLVGRNGHDLPLKLTGGGALARGVLTLTKPAETLLFTGVSEAPVLSLNRDSRRP